MNRMALSCSNMMISFMFYIFIGTIVMIEGIKYDLQKCDPKYASWSSQHSGCISDRQKVYGITPGEADYILSRHNYYRSKVHLFNNQPPAGKMMKMVWDDDIAFLAQQWAHGCIYQHDANNNRIIPGMYQVGQNLAWSTIYSWSSIVDAWQNEVELFKFGRRNRNNIGHYTQMVWDTSSRLGCGYALCNGTKHFFVCNYGPAGNYIKRLYKPYAVAAKPGSLCGGSFEPSSRLCDCAGKVCHNGGTLNVDTCECQCPSGVQWMDDVCDIKCDLVVDNRVCASRGGEWPVGYCKLYDNVGFQYCPIMCGLCPYNRTHYWGSPISYNFGINTDSTTTTATSVSIKATPVTTQGTSTTQTLTTKKTTFVTTEQTPVTKKQGSTKQIPATMKQIPIITKQVSVTTKRSPATTKQIPFSTTQTSISSESTTATTMTPPVTTNTIPVTLNNNPSTSSKEPFTMGKEPSGTIPHTTSPVTPTISEVENTFPGLSFTSPTTEAISRTMSTQDDESSKTVYPTEKPHIDVTLTTKIVTLPTTVPPSTTEAPTTTTCGNCSALFHYGHSTSTPRTTTFHTTSPRTTTDITASTPRITTLHSTLSSSTSTEMERITAVIPGTTTVDIQESSTSIGQFESKDIESKVVDHVRNITEEKENDYLDEDTHNDADINGDSDLHNRPGKTEENNHGVPGPSHRIADSESVQTTSVPMDEAITTHSETTKASTPQPTITTQKVTTTTYATVPTTTTRRPTVRGIIDAIRPLRPCDAVEPAACGQPSNSYWPASYCKYTSVKLICPAMCGICHAEYCVDYVGNAYEQSEQWVTLFGRFTCTENGILHENGCLIDDQFIPTGGQISYIEAAWEWTCDCEYQDGLYQTYCAPQYIHG